MKLVQRLARLGELLRALATPPRAGAERERIFGRSTQLDSGATRRAGPHA